MIYTRWLLVGAAVMVLALLGAATLPADEGCKKEKAKVELPEAAAKAINAAFPGATIAKVKAEDEDGMEVFEVELKIDKAEIEVTVTPCGIILEVETEVALKDVPEKARAAISKAAEGAQIKEIAKEEIRAEVKKEANGVAKLVKLETPKIVFVAELVKGDQKGEIEVAPCGKIIEELKWKAKGQDDEDNDGDDDDDAKPEAKS
ncbi:MAG: hypothetical protein NTU94_10335 [Planctomycetota bacterium]|nr:hypothetical protein [Planctomycetota bacterium]